MHTHHALLGGETSCHFFFKDRHFGYDDGVYAMFRLLELLTQSGKSLTELVTVFPKKVTSPDGSGLLSEPDTIGIDNYLRLYSTIYYETEVADKTKSGIDSLLSTPPSISFSVVDKQNKKRELFIFPMPLAANSMNQVDSIGRKLKYDPDRLYGYLQPENILVFIQQQTINKLFRRKIDFDLNRGQRPVQNTR